jgi:hypothetical protein
MRVLYVKYTLWKQIAQDQELVVYEKTIAANRLHVWSGKDDIVYQSDVETADFSDYDSSFPAGPNRVAVNDEDEVLARVIGLVTVTEPRMGDGRKLVVSSRFGTGVDPYLCGSGDKLDSPTGKGTGTKFEIEWTDQETPSPGDSKTIEWGFLDWVRIAAGGLLWKGCQFDRIDLWLDAKATPATSTPGTGNADKAEVIPSSGLHVFVPAPLGDGDWTLDLAPSLFEDAPRIVPNSSRTGYWDWISADAGFGSGTAVANPLAPNGGYDFFDFDVKLVHWVCGLPLLDAGRVSIDPKSIDRKISPQWTWSCKLTNVKGNAPLSVCFYLNLSRKSTT